MPRPCRLLARRLILARQFGVAETLAGYLAHAKSEAIRIVQRIVFSSAIVEAENLFGYIAVQMKRFHGNVGSAKTAFQQRPEVFNALSVNLPTHILFDVVDRCVNVVLLR